MTILLLRGGDKASQSRDIERAKADWREHNSRELESQLPRPEGRGL